MCLKFKILFLIYKYIIVLFADFIIYTNNNIYVLKYYVQLIIDIKLYIILL